MLEEQLVLLVMGIAKSISNQLEWHDLTEKEGLQCFSQVYYSTLKKFTSSELDLNEHSQLPLHVSGCISFHLCVIVEP